MLKIVEIIPTLGRVGGAERFFVDFCCCLSKNEDVQLYVILLYDEVNLSLRSTLMDHGINFVTCHKRKGIDLSASMTFKKILLQFNPDIIHTHNCCFFTYFLSFGYKKQAWEYFHTCHNVPKGEATKLEHYFRRRYSKKGLITNVGISKKISELFEKYYGIQKIPTVLNGINIKAVKQKFPEEKKFDFIIVARFDEEKNHMLLFQTFKHLLSEDDKLKLVCLGGGPLLDSSKAFVRSYDMENNIFFTGPVDNVYDYLINSKIFVLPSKYEGVPISILEAMNCGLPIIASLVGGIPEIVTNNKNGILIKSPSVSSLKQAMSLLIHDKALYQTMSINCSKDIKMFSMESCVLNYLRLFYDSKKTN